MGSFVFRWDHPASDVHVTGTFDDWAKSVQLEKKDGYFEKLVDLPKSDQKIYYKFVVDGTWTTDHTAPQETDDANNVNNVLMPENITKSHPSSGIAAGTMLSGVTPESSTAKLAANVPKESERDDRPVSNASDLTSSVPDTPFHEAQEYAVDPIPATSGMGNPINLAPGEKVPHPSSLTSNTISSTVKDDPSLKKSAEDLKQTFGVAPLPATSGLGNPISLQPGEKVPDPSTFTQNTIHSNVTTDQASYENSPGGPQVSGNKSAGMEGGMFTMPPISKNMIPESSLPMGGATPAEAHPGATIQSVGEKSTTAALAGQVPLEPRGVPEIVSESQHEAGAEPEASGNPEAVKEKSEMEKELESKVSEETATSEGPNGKVGGLLAGGSAGVKNGTPIAPAVPDVVQQSIAESYQSPEAAGDKTMVEEKSAMESELLKEVKTENATGEPAPSSSAALTETAPAPTDAKPPGTATNGAAGITTAAAPAQTPTTGNGMKEALQSRKPDSRDISPMSHPAGTSQTQPSQPTVTTGVGSSTAPRVSTPERSAPTPESPSAKSSAGQSTDKKSKRASGFFGKLRSKFSDKDKK